MEHRIEPKGFQIEKRNKEIVEKLYQAGLLEFLKKIDSYNAKVSKIFVSNYGDEKTTVGVIMIPITQEYLAQATRLPLIGADAWTNDSRPLSGSKPGLDLCCKHIAIHNK